MAFNATKSAQVAAWLLNRCGGNLEILKLMKLMYLGERLSLERYGHSLTGDRLVSMDHGPVLSQTLNIANGLSRSTADGWDAWMSPRQGNWIRLQQDRNVDRDDFDELSDVDIQVLDEICQRFGTMTAIEVRDFTHDNCPEWTDPRGSSRPIPLVRLFRAVGKDSELARELADDIATNEAVDRVFARR